MKNFGCIPEFKPFHLENFGCISIASQCSVRSQPGNGTIPLSGDKEK